MQYTFAAERPGTQEVYDLFAAVGWNVDSPRTIKTSLSAYPCKVCARAPDGTLVGYASVFSDTVMTTMLDELIVHPEHRKAGVGTGLVKSLSHVPRRPHVHYIKALSESKHFYARLGFKPSKMEMAVMFKKPWLARAAGPAERDTSSDTG